MTNNKKIKSIINYDQVIMYSLRGLCNMSKIRYEESNKKHNEFAFTVESICDRPIVY